MTQAPPTAAATGPAFAQLPRRTIALTLAGVLLGLLFAALDNTIVAVAMPRVVGDLGGLDRYALVFTSYMVAATATTPIAGRVSDLYGRRRIHVTGLLIFTLGSVLCGTAQGMDQLILFRAVQGIGGGIIFASTFTIAGDLFPPSERGKWQGMFASVFALASLAGPPLGGWITDAFTWRWTRTCC